MPASVYLFTGPEFGEKNDAIDSMKSDFKKKFDEVDFYRYYASENSVDSVVSDLQSGSLFASATFAVLREAELIKKKDELESLSEWIEGAKDDSSKVLILVSDEYSVDAKLEKLIPSGNKKVFWGLDEDKKEAWIINFLKKGMYGISLGIEEAAVSLILDMVEGDTASLRSECSRFFLCFPSGYVISADDVEKILAHNREESAFTLFDAMAEINLPPVKRFENSLSILQKISLSNSKSSSPVSLLAGLVSCFRKLSLWHTIHSSGAYLGDFELKKNGFTSKKQRSQYERAARVWTFGQTAAIIALISAIDMEIRSSGTALQGTLLSLLVYSIVMKNGASCSKYETSVESCL
ncbi:MAG: DNA polymerase III subunit delta [Treponema sp.]|nr:DNA polymerase III subunit delta [Treponema sp.]MBR6912990.1 DNA polymerase III subunit delta [Treponema sp.]